MASRKKVSPAEMKRMLALYDTYGTYTDVARKCGRSATTVAKYVRMGVAAGLTIETENETKEETNTKKTPKSFTITFND